jgi:hypothetical protein
MSQRIYFIRYSGAAVVLAAAMSIGVSASNSTDPNAVSSRDVRGVVDDIEENGSPCSQTWPYYEQGCLRDGRQSDGRARVARVITIDVAAERARQRR